MVENDPSQKADSEASEHPPENIVDPTAANKVITPPASPQNLSTDSGANNKKEPDKRIREISVKIVKDEELSKFEKRSLVLGWVTFVVLILTYVIFKLQLTEARTQTAMFRQQASQAAQDAAIQRGISLQGALDNQRALVLDQRPYMVLDGSINFTGNIPPKSNEPAKADMHIKNIGKAPATKIIRVARLLKRRETTREGYVKFINDSFAALDGRIAKIRKEKFFPLARQDAAPNEGIFGTEQTNDPLSDADLKELPNGKTSLFYISIVTYEDHFGNPYRTEICQFWFGTDIAVWHICDSHNTIQ